MSKEKKVFKVGDREYDPHLMGAVSGSMPVRCPHCGAVCTLFAYASEPTGDGGMKVKMFCARTDCGKDSELLIPGLGKEMKEAIEKARGFAFTLSHLLENTEISAEERGAIEDLLSPVQGWLWDNDPDYDEGESDEAEEEENIPCKKCGRTDLPLHPDYLCPDCHEAK